MKTKLVNVDSISCLLFFCSLTLWMTPLSSFALYVLVPFFILISFYNGWRLINKLPQTRFYILLIIWIFISCMVADDPNLALHRYVSIFATFLFSLATYYVATRPQCAKYLFFSYIVFFIYLLYRMLASGEMLGAIVEATEDSRDVDGINANAYAYYLFFATCSVLLLMENVKKRYIFKFLVYLILIGLTAFVAMRIAARQVFVIQLPLILFFMYTNYIKYGNKMTRILSVITLGGLIVLILPTFLLIYNDSYLALRSEVSFDDDVRSELMIKAIQNGLEHPLFGVGPENMKTFSHCSYTNLFESSGICALLLFCMIIGISISDMFRLYLKKRNRTLFSLSFVLIIYAIDNLVYSFFDVPFMMAFLFLIIGYGQVISKQKTSLCF